MFGSGNETVDKMREINLEGNIIPHTWYSQLIKETDKGTKKPYLNAIILLAEITYWYRPSKIMNEDGQLIGYKKKFKEDILQKSYKQLSVKTGLSEKAIRDAIVYLEGKGVIERKFRILHLPTVTLSNVMYIKLIIPKFMEITFPPIKDTTPVYKNVEMGVQKNREVPVIKEGDTSKKKETYTKNTTENTTKITYNFEEEIDNKSKDSYHLITKIYEKNQKDGSKVLQIYKYLKNSGVSDTDINMIITMVSKKTELLIAEYIIQQHEACINKSQTKEGLFDYSIYFCKGLEKRYLSQKHLQKIETNEQFKKTFGVKELPRIPIYNWLEENEEEVT